LKTTSLDAPPNWQRYPSAWTPTATRRTTACPTGHSGRCATSTAQGARLSRAACTTLAVLPGTAMPTRPKYPCPRCHHVRCTCPLVDEGSAWAGQRGRRRLQRPTRNSSSERKRRADVVAAFRAQHGVFCSDGSVVARCPECNKMKARFVADHIVPIAFGGTEDGPLRVHCLSCSGRQGARIARMKRTR